MAVHYFNSGSAVYGYDTDMPGQQSLIAAAIAAGWTDVTGNWPPPAPALTTAQQVAEALERGLLVESAGTPAINGVYACDDAMQAKFVATYNLIQKNGGAFPGGVPSIVWPLWGGTSGVVFTSPATFIAVDQAIGNYVFALDQIIVAGAGTLPASGVTIT